MHSRLCGALVVALAAPLAHADVAQSRIIYLTHDGVSLRPGDNDSIAGTSTVVTHPVTIPPWVTTPEIWSDTVACVSEIYARFAVTVTDVDPGDAPHIEAVLGGSPQMLGLPRSYAGISPFTDDCAVIENSIVFAFTDIMAGDARSACLTIAQEIAHSYGLDHELLDADPMTVTHTPGTKEFVDQDAACGESSPRPCGLGGSTCRASQNSYALLAERVGLVGTTALPSLETEAGGCAATNESGPGALVLMALLRSVARRRASRSARREASPRA